MKMFLDMYMPAQMRAGSGIVSMSLLQTLQKTCSQVYHRLIQNCKAQTEPWQCSQTCSFGGTWTPTCSYYKQKSPSWGDLLFQEINCQHSSLNLIEHRHCAIKLYPTLPFLHESTCEKTSLNDILYCSRLPDIIFSIFLITVISCIFIFHFIFVSNADKLSYQVNVKCTIFAFTI